MRLSEAYANVTRPVRTRFANDIAGTTADTIAVVVYSFTGTPTISGAITFSERR